MNSNRAVYSNAFWMMGEKIISIFGLIFVTSYVAKYVGPNIFGQIALATSLFQISIVVSQLGSDVLIFKRISKNNLSGIRLIISTLPIRFLLYLIVSVPVVFFSHKSNDIIGLVFIIACFLSCFFNSLDVFSIYYDARLESKKNTIINVIGLIISLCLRWFIAFFNLDVVFLAIPIVLTGFLPFIFRFILFYKNFGIYKVKRKHKKKYVRYLLFTGLTFVISSVSVALYTRISILSLGYFFDNSAVGIFSVAVSLAASWSFICNAFITSTLPSIFSERVGEVAITKTANLNVLILAVSIPIIIFICSFGYFFISMLYGENYLSAYPPLVILSIATMLSSLGVISSRFIAHYSGYSFLSKKMLAVVVCSFILNIPLVYYYGLIGAAVATLLTECISLTVFNYLFMNGIVFNMHKKVFSLTLLKNAIQSIKKIRCRR
ncbi:oligosaccharide flippase family protein [Raoultella planticola]|uniref:oligosaccharide flippase family protein n=1 Tax=Raoultella planticola TaxID=575 RepID=UPI00114E9AAF|nr:oligosaccharide flippase family protein [Raoultella planticola]TQN55426.1 oligosaccharide flippase family protein [Raoultella planticola]